MVVEEAKAAAGEGKGDSSVAVRDEIDGQVTLTAAVERVEALLKDKVTKPSNSPASNAYKQKFDEELFKQVEDSLYELAGEVENTRTALSEYASVCGIPMNLQVQKTTDGGAAVATAMPVHNLKGVDLFRPNETVATIGYSTSVTNFLSDLARSARPTAASSSTHAIEPIRFVVFEGGVGLGGHKTAAVLSGAVAAERAQNRELNSGKKETKNLKGGALAAKLFESSVAAQDASLAALKNANSHVVLAPDSNIAAYMPQIDKIVVPVFSVFPDGSCTVPVGVANLVAMAKVYNVPVIVVASSVKLSQDSSPFEKLQKNPSLIPSVASGDVLPVSMLKSLSNLSLVPDINSVDSLETPEELAAGPEIYSPEFDILPPGDVTFFVTSNGICGPNTLKKLVQEVYGQ